MHIVPKPAQVEKRAGYFQSVPTSRIVLTPCNIRIRQTAEVFSTRMRTVSGFRLPIIQDAPTFSWRGMHREAIVPASKAQLHLCSAE
ncbi:MAG: hypothetical protein J7K89_05095 [Candidatus Cloacimonetes bacterium]|nr:hypothetical protein [Candidatus Cloacimonadota bacterium]